MMDRPLEVVVKRDRTVVLASLVAVAALAWLYLADMAFRAESMAALMDAAMAFAGARPWTSADFALMFAMWSVMMVGMMLPSAAPMLLLYATIARRKRADDSPVAPTGVFAAGYLVVWTGFSLAATLLQWALQSLSLVSPMLASSSAVLGGLLLVAAGLYQWTPLKRACLRKCRSPLGFLLFRWRGGTIGAVGMGLEHGLYCLGCCWALMALLFVGGAMNLLWIAAITIFVLLEKAAPAGDRVGRIAGAGMAAWGVAVLLSAAMPGLAS